MGIEVSDIVVDENNSSVLNIDLFEDLISICNSEHISYCPCQRHNIKEKYEMFLEEEKKDMEKKGLLGNKEILEERKEYSMKLAIQSVARHCIKNNIKCPLEEKKIIQQLTFFDNKYDLKDPRVFTIIDALFHQMLSAHRMHLYSNNKGILNVWFDRQGNRRYNLNPVEEIKLKYDEARIQAIVALDKIIEGSRVKIDGNVQYEIIPSDILYGVPKKLIK